MRDKTILNVKFENYYKNEISKENIDEEEENKIRIIHEVFCMVRENTKKTNFAKQIDEILENLQY